VRCRRYRVVAEVHRDGRQQQRGRDRPGDRGQHVVRVERGVQAATQPGQRGVRVPPLAVEQPVHHPLHRVPGRGQAEGDHDRGDDRAAAGTEPVGRDADADREHSGHRGAQHRIDQRPVEQALPAVRAVPEHRHPEGDRHQRVSGQRDDSGHRSRRTEHADAEGGEVPAEPAALGAGRPHQPDRQ